MPRTPSVSPPHLIFPACVVYVKDCCSNTTQPGGAFLKRSAPGNATKVQCQPGCVLWAISSNSGPWQWSDFGSTRVVRGHRTPGSLPPHAILQVSIYGLPNVKDPVQQGPLALYHCDRQYSVSQATLGKARPVMDISYLLYNKNLLPSACACAFIIPASFAKSHADSVEPFSATKSPRPIVHFTRSSILNPPSWFSYLPFESFRCGLSLISEGIAC